jgi:AcrR family transcriptional regulator
MSDPAPNATEPRWRRLPEERPGQILDAALEVFGERGLAATRLEDVAKSAGVSKGTIYLYFQNKEDLFREMVRQNVVAQIERGEAVLATSSGDATDTLRAVVRGHWEFSRRAPYANLLRLVIAELHNFPDLARFYADEVMSRGLALYIGIVRRGIASGEFRPMEERVAARMVLGLLLSHTLWSCKRDLFTHVCDRGDDAVVDEVLDFLLHALRPASTGPLDA